VLRLNPGYVKAHANLGVALYKLGRAQEAVQQFDQVLSLDPQNRQALEFKQQALNHQRPQKP
jgi:tetratricopeptide (TPR) repeat protein